MFQGNRTLAFLTGRVLCQDAPVAVALQINNSRASAKKTLKLSLAYEGAATSRTLHSDFASAQSFLNILSTLRSRENVNDPSAGSPTETLLRLLLPLNDQVWTSFRAARSDPKIAMGASPKASLNHSIGSSDGRCVQRAGT